MPTRSQTSNATNQRDGLILSLIALLSTATIEFLIKDAVSARFDLGEVKVVIGSVALEMKTTLSIILR
jgi:hypothetical protein